MATEIAPLVLVNAVGMTARWLEHAPRMRALSDRGWLRSLREVVPAVTCTAQATLLTGQPPNGHGVVANGWLFRDTMEVRFWQQSNRLLQAEPLYATARRIAEQQGRPFRTAKLFWWFNQGAAVDYSVTPKPHYAADGNKAFGIAGSPDGLTTELERRLGPFPFRTFWGPGAGLACTQWIARCAAWIVQQYRPELTLVYLPHLDFDPQRHGPSGTDMPKHVRDLDDAFGIITDAATAAGARVWVVSEYCHVDVKRPVYLNRALRKDGLLTVRSGPFGEMLDTFESRAFAVCDHQLAHVYVRAESDLERVRNCVQGVPGVGKILFGDARATVQLDHPRSGELIILAESESWFAYPYWLVDRLAPDFARTVDIHRKPGFDPCEMFFDPQLWWVKGRIVRKLIQKKLGFRTLFNVIPLDASIVGGSHGLLARDPRDQPLLIGDGPVTSRAEMQMTEVRDVVLGALGA